jgi:type II secretory pathway pseudopilin PulG
MNKTQKGFALMEGLLIILILAIIGFGGYYVWNSQKNTNKSLNNADKASQSISAANSSAAGNNFSTYNSTLGGFSFKYPSNWMISGFIGDQPPVDKLTGSETQVRVQEKADTARTENFGGDFKITDSAPGDTPYPFYPQGRIIKTFSNGVSVWVDNLEEKGADGSTIRQDCPGLQIASNDAYGFKLKNGMWLSYFGSFCWGQGFSTSLSYNDQLKSPQVAETLNMLESIRQ